LPRKAIAAIRAGHNQYTRSGGLLLLTRAVAAHQERFYGLDYDAESEITTYAGATEAIFSTLSALLDPGDEVVFFEPFYDSYPACVALAGAEAKVITLRPPSFDYDPGALEASIGPRTRAILLNTPNNPSGKVFSRRELEQIAELCRRHDLIAITDEVYEHLVFEGEHVPLATLPGMRERTVLISSTGKTFSFTGWKIGYTCAPPALTAALRTVHQVVTFWSRRPSSTPWRWP
jgi:N-succinyldiaminopimelate aminotransferase